jgi:acylphosphatase
MKKRLRVVYSGNVQGVGFRYTARSIAQGLSLTGWVRNVPNGAVELIAEGEENDLVQLIANIKSEMNFANFKENTHWEPVSGEFLRFEIRY